MPITLGPVRKDVYNATTPFVEGQGQTEIPEIGDGGFQFEATDVLPPMGTQQEMLAKDREIGLMGGKSKPQPSFVGAVLRQGNEIASVYDAAMNKRDSKRDPNYDIMDDIRGTKYEDHYDSIFVGSMSHEDTMHRVYQLERELADREKMWSKGTAWGLVGAMAAGTLSPLALVPIGGPAYKTFTLGKAARRAISVSKSAGKTALGAAGGIAVQEALLQKSQDERPLMESLFAVGTGALLGGIIGGGLAHLAKPKATLKKFNWSMEHIAEGRLPIDPVDLGAVTAGASVGAARVLEEGTGEIVGGKFLKAIGMASFSPVTRLQTSVFKTARNIVRHMEDAGLMLKDNLKGIVTSVGGTIATRVKLARGPLMEATTRLEQLYADHYLGRAAGAVGRKVAKTGSSLRQVAGRLGGKLGLNEFSEEVSRAMANGDVHHLPEVQEAARYFREKVFNPLKEKAIRLGMLAKDVKAKFAESYITRMFNTEKIFADQRGFKELLVREFRKSQPESKIDNAELFNEAEEITNKILGMQGRNSFLDIVASNERGPLAERLLAISDNVLDPYLERDIRKIATYYTHTMASDIELTAKFGSANMETQIADLTTEYNRLDAVASSAKVKKKLRKEYDGAVRDIEALRDRIRGTYRIPENSRGLLMRAGRIARHWVYQTKLGGMMLASIPDLAKPVFTHGLLRSFGQGYFRLITDFNRFRMAASEVKKFGTALDVSNNHTSALIYNVFDKFQHGTKFERGVEWMSTKMSMATLMAPWNAALKQISGMIYMDRALRAMEKAAKGKARTKGGFFHKSDTDFLRSAGIDDDMAREIWHLFENGGGDRVRGLYLPNAESWGQGLSGPAKRRAMDLRDAFAAAVVRDVDNVIVTPGLERPLAMDTEIGGLIFQLKTFAMSSTQRMLISGLQTPDLAMINGITMSVALGAYSAKFRMDLAGYDTSHWGPVKWVTEGIDRSGITGVFSEANNVLEKMHPMLGLSAITGETASRYQSRGKFGATLGPTVGLIDDAFDMSNSIGVEGWGAADTHRVAKLIPYNNIFYLRTGFDKMEEEINKFWGIPARKPRKKPKQTR